MFLVDHFGTIACVTSVTTRKADGRSIVTLTDGRCLLSYRLIAAVKIGRPLTAKEVVHHINGDHTDDRFENLEVLANQAEHSRLHDALGASVQRKRDRVFCKRGHPYSEENTYTYYKRGGRERICKTCLRLTTRERNARKKAESCSL